MASHLADSSGLFAPGACLNLGVTWQNRRGRCSAGTGGSRVALTALVSYRGLSVYHLVSNTGLNSNVCLYSKGAWTMEKSSFLVSWFQLNLFVEWNLPYFGEQIRPSSSFGKSCLCFWAPSSRSLWQFGGCVCQISFESMADALKSRSSWSRSCNPWQNM